MQIIRKIRRKLELDNPDKYIDGYYQLSKKQKLLWVGGLFLVGVVFLFLTGPSSKSHLLDTVLSFLFSFILLTVSFLYSCLCYYPSLYLFRIKEERKKIAKKTIVVLYQIWTVFLVIAMLLIVLRINYNYEHILLLFIIILLINFTNHKKL